MPKYSVGSKFISTTPYASYYYVVTKITNDTYYTDSYSVATNELRLSGCRGSIHSIDNGNFKSYPTSKILHH